MNTFRSYGRDAESASVIANFIAFGSVAGLDIDHIQTYRPLQPKTAAGETMTNEPTTPELSEDELGTPRGDGSDASHPSQMNRHLQSEIHQWFALAEGRFDLSLSHSACQSLKVGDLLDEAELRAFAEIGLAYGTFAGLAELCESIADSYTTIEPSQVLTFNGPSEAIYTVMRAVLQPGDQIVVPSPVFHPLQAIARQIGCEVKAWRARDEHSCTFNVDDLAAICDSSTKLIVINFPHNPSGQMISESELHGIIEIAESVDAVLFSDEVFRLLELPPLSPLPAACDLYAKAVSMAGLSKPFGLGGLRIGWMATQCEELLAAVREYRYVTAEMTNTPCQWLGCRAMRKADEIIVRNRATISANLDVLATFVEAHAGTLKLYRPQAGTMALVEQQTSLSSTDFCQRVLDDQRLFLIPGNVLGMSDRLLRFGLGMTDQAQSLDRLDRFLQGLKESGEAR